MKQKLEIGQNAPDFTLKDDGNKTVSLLQFKGKKVVVYFYPKDDTPGCTKEACGFRDVYDKILAKNAVVIGISADDAESHVKFRKKYDLPFYLLSDPSHKVLGDYEAWGEKNMYGKLVIGIMRKTYVIDEKGKILKIYPKVKPEEHAEEILGVL